MVKKKTHKKTSKKSASKKSNSKKNSKAPSPKEFPTLKIKKETDIAMDFATKIYERFDKIIKSVVLFGSTAKGTNGPSSDIDIVIILDDVSINWDQELIAWYRE
jgi:tRNA nucleotidyltransferase (CCA-adding enzyme)